MPTVRKNLVPLSQDSIPCCYRYRGPQINSVESSSPTNIKKSNSNNFSQIKYRYHSLRRLGKCKYVIHGWMLLIHVAKYGCQYWNVRWFIDSLIEIPLKKEKVHGLQSLFPVVQCTNVKSFKLSGTPLIFRIFKQCKGQSGYLLGVNHLRHQFSHTELLFPLMNKYPHLMIKWFNFFYSTCCVEYR